MIKIGPKARIQGLRPELNVANLTLDGILRQHGNLTMILTHALDGVHSRASIHYMGGAEDLVFVGEVTAEVKVKIHEEFVASVGQDFDILLEDAGKPNEHIHVEFQPKEPYK